MSVQNTNPSPSKFLAALSRATPRFRAAAVLALVAGLPAAAQTTYHVASCGDDAWTGASANCEGPNGPKSTIQAAIDASADGDTVLVADGVYSGSGNRDMDFGGRAITLRSAGGASACVIDCDGSFLDPHYAFSFHSAETESSVLEGFTIRNAEMPGYWGGAIYCSSSPLIRACRFDENSAHSGAAIYVDEASLSLIQCTFSGNTAEFAGAAIYAWYSDLSLTDCAFSDNTAAVGGGAVFNWGAGNHIYADCTFVNNNSPDPDNNGGGAVQSSEGGTDTMTNCRVIENSTGHIGGGVWFRTVHATVTDCTFIGNSGGTGGGLAVSRDSQGTIVNCLFSGNSTTDEEAPTAALWVGDGLGGPSSATIVNCTFSQHAGPDSGAALLVTQTSHADVANCVFWGDAPMEIALTETATIDVSYSAVQGGWPGAGNIDADPLFTNPDPDALDFSLAPGSPCIDAADNTAVPPDTADLDADGDTGEPTPLDLGGLARFVDDPATDDTGVGTPPIVDMGAHEFQVCDADCDASGALDLFDFLCFTNLFNAGDPKADFDADGVLDLFDFLAFVNAFNTGC